MDQDQVVSIPHWSDFNDMSTDVVVGFAMFQSHIGPISTLERGGQRGFGHIGFNPTLVRFQPIFGNYTVVAPNGFNPTLVRFQLKSGEEGSVGDVNTVSIPHWSDFNLESLMIMPITTQVSIPHWSDFNTAIPDSPEK